VACRRVCLAPGQHVVDHALQAHALAVLGRIDARNAVGLELADFLGDDHPASASEHLDVFASARAQQVEHELEVLQVAALVGGHRDPLNVLLERRRHDLLDRAVVAEVDHLAAARLKDTAHDVDRGVMAVEQRRRGDEANLVLCLVFGMPRSAQVGHGSIEATGARVAAPGRGWRDGRAYVAPTRTSTEERRRLWVPRRTGFPFPPASTRGP